MDKIAIHSVPRSGSSWLGEIINSSPNVSYAFQPLFSYAFKGQISEESTNEEVERFFTEIAISEDAFVKQQDDRESGKKPRFNKGTLTTTAYKEVRYHYILENMLAICPDIKVIGLVRNPFTVISSWYNAPREFRKDLGWKLEEELLLANQKNQGRKEEYFGLNKWIETTLLFEKLQELYPKQFTLIRYEELVAEPVNKVEELFSFLGLEYGEQTQAFINNNKEVDGTYSVHKKKTISDLKNVDLPSNIIKKIESTLIENQLTHYT